MDKQIIISETKGYIKGLFDTDVTGHDFWHMKRVAELAREIAIKENADPFICEMAGWLHDVTDSKLTDQKDSRQQEMDNLLQRLGVTDETKGEIYQAIADISYRGNHQIPATLEGKIVQDADRLDAIGAIGVARTFAYGGNKGQLLHDPNLPLLDEEKNYYSGTSVQHFYDKLLKLKDLMNTATAIEIADERHRFMEGFLEQFFREWNSEWK